MGKNNYEKMKDMITSYENMATDITFSDESTKLSFTAIITLQKLHVDQMKTDDKIARISTYLGIIGVSLGVIAVGIAFIL